MEFDFFGQMISEYKENMFIFFFGEGGRQFFRVGITVKVSHNNNMTSLSEGISWKKWGELLLFCVFFFLLF
jgi:hypothetical protein